MHSKRAKVRRSTEAATTTPGSTTTLSRPGSGGAAPSPGSFVDEPASIREFSYIVDYVDKSVPYVKLRRMMQWFLAEDASTGLEDPGPWSDLGPDKIEPPGPARSPQRERTDWDFEEPVRIPTVRLRGGPIRARLGEIGVSRYEWERLDPSSRRVIMEYVQAEAKLAQVVVAAVLVPRDHSAKEFQRKSLRFLEDVTETIRRRADATLSPLRAIHRDQAWHAAQPLLGRLTEVLEGIEAEAKHKDLVHDHAWVARQVARVNDVLTSYKRVRLHAYCTPEILSTLSIASARDLALKITHLFFPDVAPDDLRRRTPPRQR